MTGDEKIARRMHGRYWASMDADQRAASIERVRDVRVALEPDRDLLVSTLQSICETSIPELDPDGVDQAAHSMRLIAVTGLEAVGATVPEQRESCAGEVGWEQVVEMRASTLILTDADRAPRSSDWTTDADKMMAGAMVLLAAHTGPVWLEHRSVTYGPVQRVDLMDGEGRPQPEGDNT